MAVYFSLDTQFENLGDEVINGLLLRELSRRQSLRILIGQAPEWYLANVASAVCGDVKFTNDRKRYIRDFLIGSVLPPGNTMLLSCGDTTTVQPDAKRSRTMSLLTKLPFLKVAQVGASRLKLNDTDKDWLARAANKSGLITVRDEYSRQTLEASSIKTRVMPDLAFLLNYQRPKSPTKALFMLRQTDADRAAVVTQLVAMVARSRDLGLEPVFGWQVARDENYNRALAEQTGAGLLMLPGSGQDRLAPTLESYSDVAVIISNRLHGLLLAASRGALPVPILSDSERKVRGVFEHAGLAHLLLSDALAPGASANTLTEIVTKQGPLADSIEQAFKANSTSLQEGFDAMFGPVRNA